MTRLIQALVAIGWCLTGVVAAGRVARWNRSRGHRRVPSLERRLGALYLAGAILGPLSIVIGGAFSVLVRRADASDEREARTARADRLAASRRPPVPGEHPS